MPALVRTVRDAGWSEGRITQALGLRRDQIALERRIPLDKYFALLDLAAEVSGDPCFGLHFGAVHAFDTAGVFGYILRNSPNVGVAITNAMRYLRLHVDAAELSLELAGPEVRLVYRLTDPRIRPSRHYAALVMVYALKGVRLAVDQAWSPNEVRFRHPPPADTSPYERLFGAPVRFDQEVDALVLDRRLLSRPLSTADHQLLRILEERAQEILAELPAPDDLVERLERFVLDVLPGGDLSLDAAARALGMGARTLQRRLHERNIIYAQLLDELRQRLSDKYLADAGLSLTEIAYLLGYSQISAFNRAHRRWTGQTPSAARRSAGG